MDIPRAGVEALQIRTKHAVLTSAWLGKADNLKFFQGALNAYQGLLGLTSLDWLARQDAVSGGYQPSSLFVAAWASLPENLDQMTIGEVQNFLHAHGVQLSDDAVANSNVGTINQVKNSELAAVIHSDNEALGLGVDQNDFSSAHAPIVQQGGAA